MIDNKIILDIKDLRIDIDRIQIIERLMDRFRWPIFYPWHQPSVEIISPNGQKKHTELFYDDGYLNSSKVINLYENGYTLLLSNIGNLFFDISKLQHILNQHFSFNVCINLYAGYGTNSVSFDNHKHDYDVIVKNVCGNSEWLYDNNHKIILKDQEVLFLPKNTFHQVTKILDDKISLTCNII
jgi:hypothetical protein